MSRAIADGQVGKHKPVTNENELPLPLGHVQGYETDNSLFLFPNHYLERG